MQRNCVSRQTTAMKKPAAVVLKGDMRADVCNEIAPVPRCRNPNAPLRSRTPPLAPLLDLFPPVPALSRRFPPVPVCHTAVTPPNLAPPVERFIPLNLHFVPQPFVSRHRVVYSGVGSGEGVTAAASQHRRRASSPADRRPVAPEGGATAVRGRRCPGRRGACVRVARS